MYTIALPKKIEFEKGDKPNEGKIIIEPLNPGYGITLGNSLRRVLLSSLPGAAIIGIKIKGVDHEFMTLAHLKEDILEFILNLKQVRLKIFSDEVVKLELSIHGLKEIVAGDIKKNSSVEVVNEDLVLGHITDMAGRLDAEIFAKRGMGYEMIENRESKSNEIGYIEMYSIYSPIFSVGVEISNVRVGKMTNWDRLTLKIISDGTITPEEAFKNSVKILTEQFNALISEKNIEEDVKPLELDSITEKSKIFPDENNEITRDEPEVPAEEEAKKKRGRPKKSE
jgi:DNA-directed RNA polymerase subunit alpha